MQVWHDMFSFNYCFDLSRDLIFNCKASAGYFENTTSDLGC